MILDPNAIDVTLDRNDETVVAISNRNGGNGPLAWSVQRVFPGGADIEPWTYRGGFNAGDILDNRRLGGIEFVGDNFYIAGGFNDQENQIYVFDREGNLERQFPQFADSRTGFRDLAYDGELLYGIDGNLIYAFTTDGELIREFECPVHPGRSIAWDPVRELLWVCYVTTNIVGVDREGNVQASFVRPDGIRVYGLAWFPDDPDDYNLFVFSNGGDYGQQLYKVNVETERGLFIRDMTDVEGASANGLAVSGLYDPYSWVVMGVLDGPDCVGIWQIAPRTDWLQIEPTEGVVEPGEEIELSVTLNSLGLPENEVFEADLVFSHDGIGAVTEVPVILRITGNEQVPSRELAFNQGWNMVSLNIDPIENGIIPMMAPLVDAGLLAMMKDGDGRFYNPQFGFNNIPGWNFSEGYLIKVVEDCNIVFEGNEIPWNTPRPLENGWQLVSYYPRVAVDAVLALSGIVDNLLIAKDGAGRFYSPPFGFSNLGDMRETLGYLIKVEGDVELIYTIEEGLAIRNQDSFVRPERGIDNDQLSHFPIKNPTNSNMSLLLKTETDYAGFEIGCFNARGIIIGSARVDDKGYCGLAAWGDDPLTETIDGLKEGEHFELRGWDGEREIELDPGVLNFLEGRSLAYEPDGFLAVEIGGISTVPVEFYLSQPYPNPFNSSIRISFGLPEGSNVELSIFDINCRLITEIVNGTFSAGTHTMNWDASIVSAGIYVIWMKANGFSSSTKVMLLK